MAKEHADRFTDDDIRKAWLKEDGQGNAEARAMAEDCVVVIDCDEEKALAVTRLFLEHFDMPTCTYYVLRP